MTQPIPHTPGAQPAPNPDFDFDWDDIYRGDGSDTGDPDPLLLAPVDGLTPGLALDLGCGAGGNALALAARGWRVTGVDIAPRAIVSTRATASERHLSDLVDLAVADSAAWQPETTYDFVLSSYSLPPRGPARTATLAAALAPGAVLALGEWDEEACDWGKEDDLVTVDELTEAFTGLGLEIDRAERTLVPVHQHPGHEQERGEDHAVIVIARRPHGTLEATL